MPHVKVSFCHDQADLEADFDCYAELAAAISARFNTRSFRLTYVDPEGDTCAVTSDDELAEALRVVAENGEALLQLHGIGAPSHPNISQIERN
jgi:hypothetical protein